MLGPNVHMMQPPASWHINLPGLLSAQVASASGVIRLAARVAKKNKKLGAGIVPNIKWDVIAFNMGSYGM